jgi:hypothetical protein
METNFELKSCDILHCTRKGVLSSIIRWATKSKYSHTAMVIEIWGKLFIIDSQKDGTNVRPLEEWLKDYKYQIIVARGKISKTRARELSMRAISKSGHTGYDFITLLFRAPWGILTGKWLKDKRPSEKTTCSEFIMWTFEQPDFDRASPQAVYDFTEANNYEHKIYVYTL